MSLERIEEGLYADGTAMPFARHHYSRFWRTSRAMGWEPVDMKKVSRLLKQAYMVEMGKLMREPGPSSAFRALLARLPR